MPPGQVLSKRHDLFTFFRDFREEEGVNKEYAGRRTRDEIIRIVYLSFPATDPDF